MSDTRVRQWTIGSGGGGATRLSWLFDLDLPDVPWEKSLIVNPNKEAGHANS